MQSRNDCFAIHPVANIMMESVFNATFSDVILFPPIAGNFELLNNTPFMLLDGTDLLLL